MSSLPDAVPARIRQLWLRMASIYGHRWTSAYGEDAGAGAGPIWDKGLASVTSAQLAAGIQAALVSADPWPPTLPAFRAMCLGIPSLAAVKLEVRKGSPTRSPFLRLVWERLDGYLFGRSDADKSERMLAEAYQLAAEYVMLGGPLPEPAAAAIEDNSKPSNRPDKPADPAVARAELQKMAKLLRAEEVAVDE